MSIDNDNIYDNVQADQVEDGDQVIIDGDALERVIVSEDPTDDDGVVITGWSVETGDHAVYILPYDYPVSLWAL